MVVKVFDPKIKVVVKKNVTRSFIAGGDGLGGEVPASARFKNAERVLDLTPFIGEYGSVSTVKSVREPAGQFSITLTDRMYVGTSKQQESLYGLIEPMDVVEIRMAKAPTAKGFESYKQMEYGLPIVMRGFVSSIKKSITVTPDGKPIRSVTISGFDYGKLWQIMQIKYVANYVLGQNLMTFLKFAENYGVNSNVEWTPNQFIAECIQSVFNTFTAEMRKTDENNELLSPVSDVTLFDLTVPDAKVSPFGVNNWEGGTVYQLMAHYGDVGAFNELFLEDREAGVAVVYRPNPFLTPAGDYITAQSEAYKPTSGTVDALGVRSFSLKAVDIKSEQLGRSDDDVSNYYWVDAPSYSMMDMSALRLQDAGSAPETYYLEDYRNSLPSLYGLRMMQIQTNQGQRFDGKKQSEVVTGKGDFISWLDDRRATLVAANRDNVLFESGTIAILGNEQAKAGMYADVDHGALKYKAYVTRVQHTFSPFRSFDTVLTVERGTGFIARAQLGQGKQSPWLAETNAGGVYK